jgi:hypothetical protein
LLNLHRRSQFKRYDEGGTTRTVNFGGVGQLEPVNTSDSALSDSERTQNYLMGNGPNPFAFHYSNERKVVPATKASDDTGIAAINRTNLVDDNDVGISRLVDRSGDVSSIVNKSDTGGQDFGVTNQPPGAVFNINDFDAVNEFGIGSQPVGTTFDINDFDNNTSAGTVDNSVNDFGIGNQPDGNTFDINDFDNNTSAGTVDNSVNDIGYYDNTTGEVFGVTNQPDDATFDINNFDNNTSAGTVNTGDSGSYTGDAGDGMDNVDTSNSEIFSQEYVDPRADPMEAAERLEQSEMNEGYFGGYNNDDSSSNSGSDYGGGFDSGFDGGFDSGFGGDYGIGGGGDYGYDMSYRAKGGPIKSNFKNARNINAYRSGLTNYADGGLGSLGGYSDGGRLLRGPGDGVSDSIPATIGQRQPARLADGEFVVPARIVSELGNGSTEAGARQLYAMMDRIQKGRRKTVGKNKVAANTRSAKHLPA